MAGFGIIIHEQEGIYRFPLWLSRSSEGEIVVLSGCGLGAAYLGGGLSGFLVWPPMLFGKSFTGPEYIPRLVTAQMEPCQY
jgi:hypothetical protein